MKKPIIQKFAPALWIVSGLLFLLPTILNVSKSQAPIGVGIMFIIFGIVSYKKKKSNPSASKEP